MLWRLKDRSQALCVLGLLVVLVLIYWPSLRGPFTLDDTHTIENNASIQTLDNFFRLWMSGKYYSSLSTIWSYRPLTAFSNLILWQVGGGATWPYHVFKVLLFFGLVVLARQVWLALIRDATSEVGWVAAFIFAASPAHSQVVGYISATSSLLASFFGVLAIHSYLRWRSGGQPWRIWLTWIAALMATLSKEEGLMVFALVPMVEIYLIKSNDRGHRIPVWKVQTLWIMTGFLMGSVLLFTHESTQNISRGNISSWTYFMTQWRAYIRYIWSFWIPIDRNADNLAFGFSSQLMDVKVLAALAANALVLGVMGLSWRKFPEIALALGWFYVSVLPSSSVVVLAEPVNDHRCMMAYVGLGLVNVRLLSSLSLHRRMVAMALACVMVIYSIGTFRRALDWGDEVRLWRDTVAKNPESGRAHNNLAVALMAEQRNSEALEVLSRCVSVAASYGYCFLNRGIVLARLGRDLEAEKDFETSLPMDLNYSLSRQKFADYLVNRGMNERARALLEEANKFVQGYDLSIAMQLMGVQVRVGDLEAARQTWSQARDRFGRHPQLISVGLDLGLTEK